LVFWIAIIRFGEQHLEVSALHVDADTGAHFLLVQATAERTSLALRMPATMRPPWNTVWLRLTFAL
jgi:hypothetical protein